MAALFAASDALTLIVPAEGTRSWVPYWKSGFYHIASTAGVPIVMGYLDYARKRGGFGPALMPSGDVRRDMDEIRAFYADKIGKYPASTGEVRLREEPSSDEPADVGRVPEADVTMP
jgi:1-acyl-sn-glycerol-3-phosphate acyltransferase